MSLFGSIWKSPEETAPTGSETVARLCERVSSSERLEDRRDAVRALKSLSKKFRYEVGSQGLPLLIEVLKADSADDEITAYAIDCIFNLTAINEEDEDEHNNVQPEIVSSLISTFCDEPDNVNLVLDLIERYDFNVRWSAVRLLTSLIRHKPSEIQQIILVKPMGISHLMDLLSDGREVIRNDALLALIEVTRGNGNIQKIVAFENGFEVVFKIMMDEGLSDGGVVVEDCILLLLHLLKNNISNQQFFKEGSLTQRLTPFFEIESESVWSAQKNANILLMLKVVRMLVSPTNPSHATASCQLAMQYCSLLQRLSDLLMATGVPTDILTETINTVSEMIRGCKENQQYFAGIMAPWDPPRPALVVLLMSMVNSQQPFSLRCAVLYCFQCYLHKNIDGQCSIVNTLLPSSLEPQEISAGQLLCGGLFAQADPLSNWLAAIALCHALKGNDDSKSQLLRVQLATAPGNPPVTLLKQITNIIIQTPNIQTRIGLLSFLCGWLNNCSVAVQYFLDDPASVPFLLGLAGENGNELESLIFGICCLLLGICILNNDGSVAQYTKETLIELIIARIGIERFCDTLSSVTQSDFYSKALQRPQPIAEVPEHLLLDHSFVKLFKSLEDTVVHVVSHLDEIKKEEETKAAIEAHDAIVDQYKTLIREQDEKLNQATSKCQELESELNSTKSQLISKEAQVQQLKDQYNLLKLTSAAPSNDDNGESTTTQQIETLINEKYVCEAELASKSQMIKDLQDEVNQLKNKQSEASFDSANDALMAEKVAMQNNLTQALEKISIHEKTISNHELENKELSQKCKQLEDKIADFENTCANYSTKIKEVVDDNTSIKKEQDDLFVLLSDQEIKIKEYKVKLREHGEEVSSDEDDDFDDEEDDEGEDSNDDEEEHEVENPPSENTLTEKMNSVQLDDVQTGST